MKPSVIEVEELLSALSAAGVETRIGLVAGAKIVTTSFAVGSPTMRHDETRPTVGDMKSGVRQIGNESDASSAGPTADKKGNHSTPDAPPTSSASASTSNPKRKDALIVTTNAPFVMRSKLAGGPLRDARTPSVPKLAPAS